MSDHVTLKDFEIDTRIFDHYMSLLPPSVSYVTCLSRSVSYSTRYSVPLVFRDNLV